MKVQKPAKLSAATEAKIEKEINRLYVAKPDFKKGLAYFKALYKNHLTSLPIVVLLGLSRAYHGLGRNDQAMVYAKKGLESSSIHQEPKVKSKLLDICASVELDNKNFKKAMVLSKNSIKMDPKFFLAYLTLSRVYFGLGKKQKADAVLKSAMKKIKYKPSLAQIYIEASCQSSSVEEYFKYDLKSTQLDPKNSCAFSNLAYSYLELKKHTLAAAAAQKAIKLDPMGVSAFVNLSYAYLELKKYDSARQAAEKAIKLDPKNPMAFNNLGFSYYNLNNYSEAIKNYKKALNLNPQHELAKANLENALDAQKKIFALKVAQKAIKLRPNSPSALVKLSLAYILLGKSELAIQPAQKAIKLNPKNRRAFNYLFLACMDLNLGGSQLALRSVKKAINLAPENSDIFNDLFSTLINLERYELALQVAERAVFLDPKNVWVFLNLFLAYFSLGKNDLALSALTEAPKPGSKDCYAFNRLGWYYYKMRNYTMAMKYCETAIKIKPTDYSTQASLFEIYYAVAQDKNSTVANRKKYLGLAKKYLKLCLIQCSYDDRAYYYRCVLLNEHALCKLALKYYQGKGPEIEFSNDKAEKIKELKAMLAAKKK